MRAINLFQSSLLIKYRVLPNSKNSIKVVGAKYMLKATTIVFKSTRMFKKSRASFSAKCMKLKGLKKKGKKVVSMKKKSYQ